jgi:hypothetical protein
LNKIVYNDSGIIVKAQVALTKPLTPRHDLTTTIENFPQSMSVQGLFLKAIRTGCKHKNIIAVRIIAKSPTFTPCSVANLNVERTQVHEIAKIVVHVMARSLFSLFSGE